MSVGKGHHGNSTGGRGGLVAKKNTGRKRLDDVPISEWEKRGE